MNNPENNLPNPEHREYPEVDLIKIDPASKEKIVVATCKLIGGRVEIIGEPNFVKILKQGVKTYPNQNIIMPNQGKVYLDAVQQQFRSAYLFAEAKK
ncbi:MAG: hypothetical protein ACOYUZ_03795 [Patescibacteria group bacterium]